MGPLSTYDEDDDDDEDVNIDADNQMMLKRVEYSSRELEQLKLLDAAIEDDSDSLHFPDNDNMDLTDNDEFESLEEATSIILSHQHKPCKSISDKANKSILENDTDHESDANNLHLVTTTNNLNTKQLDAKNAIGEANQNVIVTKESMNKKD